MNSCMNITFISLTICLLTCFFLFWLFVDHPYVEERQPDLDTVDRGSPVGVPDTSDDSLHLHLSLSEVEDQSTCDSFVTCDGEVSQE